MEILKVIHEKAKILPWKILAEFKGKDIEGCQYEQLLPFEANSLEVEKYPGANLSGSTW